MEIGIRAHDLGRMPVAELAVKIREKGFGCIQLALQKALSEPEYVPGKLDSETAGRIGRILESNGIRTGVLGCYHNLMHPDDDKRKIINGMYLEHVKFARSLQSEIVGTETGSLALDYSFHSDNHSLRTLELFAERITPIVKAAEEEGVFFAVEGVATHVINTPERMKLLLDMIDSPNLKVILDPVNFIDHENFESEKEIISKSFELFGDKICTVHLKDYVISDGERKTVQAFSGKLDMKHFLSLVKKHIPVADILLENCSPENMNNVKSKLTDLYESI